MGIEIHNPATLPANDNVPGNDYAFCVEMAGQPWFTSKGAMIAYYGNINFEPLGRTSMTAIVAARFSSPLYADDWVLAQGQGKLILGDRGFNINSYDLDDGNLTIRAANLLAFETSLDLKQSIVPGFLTLLGTGKFLASSNSRSCSRSRRCASTRRRWWVGPTARRRPITSTPTGCRASWARFAEACSARTPVKNASSISPEPGRY